ncbi:MAG: hypothetical protein WC076_07365 [Terrimicrobiaceae bacterium]|jgi:hypothetical protein|nr:hypothetical protein [Terrimicrobiaceae bacterium]
MNFGPLGAALRNRLDVVADHTLRNRDPAAHLEAIKAAHRALELQVAALSPGTDPRLLHFLERQSYEKALALLQSENGFPPSA